MKFINFSVIKFAFFLTVGIIIAHLYPNVLYFYLAIVLYTSLLIIWFISKDHLFQTTYFGILTYTCFFFLGAVTYQINLPEFQKHEYYPTDSIGIKENILQLKVKEVLKSDTYNSKYIAEVIAINNNYFNGKILLNIKKDSFEKILNIDDLLLISSKIKKIYAPLNPHQFDYSMYMKSLGIYNQIYISYQGILNQSKGILTLRGQASKIRNHLIKKLKKNELTPNEIAIVQALILGQKKDINKQLYSDYAAAGAIHILAVSGLHVGIIYFILIALLRPLKYLFKYELVISIIIVISLWGFAFLTGLSPSVIRAVTMFSFFAFAKAINRETNTINTLFLSYFTLLIINPLWLFHIGFQLSYLAVLSILWLYPLFNKVYCPKNYFARKIWDIFTLTLAAQIGIFPLSIYYFHQFPGLFFMTNLIILPFLGVLLGGGIILIILSVFNVLPEWFALTYNYLIKFMNSCIHVIANQKFFLFQNITFSLYKVFVSYLLIIFIILFWNYQNRKNTLFFAVGLSILFSVSIFDNYSNSKNELIIFHKNKQSIIGNKNNSVLNLYTSDSILNIGNSYPIKTYKVAKGITDYSEIKSPYVFKCNEKLILVMDSLGIYPNNYKIDIILLTYSPKINLNRILESLQPNLIIADGSNYKSYVKRWKKSCTNKNIAFHFTGTDGAYIIKNE
jgi:competence protein ComEC